MPDSSVGFSPREASNCLRFAGNGARVSAHVMQIDRSSFLLLTASIAGSSCGSNSASTSGGPIVVASPVVALPGPEATTSPSVKVASGGKPGQTAVNASDEETLAALDRSPGAAAEDGSMCEEVGPAPTGCSTLRAPGPQCESFADTRRLCGVLAKGLRPKVAEKAVECILARSGKQSVCDFNLANQCGLTAVQRGCLDPSTQNSCTALVRNCNGNLQMRDCQALLSSVTSKNRRNMISCMTEGCSVEYCMYDVQ